MKYSIIHSDKNTSARAGVIKTEHGNIQTPVFMPVGTLGAVKTFSPHELEGLGADIILGNTYHLYLRPGIDIINEAGGLHNFSNWTRPMLTDSGGFQVFSLAKLNKISDEGVEFQSHLDGSYHSITPEVSMEIQRALGSDIIMAFDHCPPGKASNKEVIEAVDRTNKWFKRCKKYLQNNPSYYGHSQTLFPIIQGGVSHELRKISIDGLAEHADFGIAIGGLAVGEEKNAMFDTIEYCDSLLLKDRPRYLMGVGRPTDIVKSIRLGIDMFDCVMPSRNARNGMVFTANGTINIKNKKWELDFSPLDSNNYCFVDTLYSKSYVRHLFSVNEMLGKQICTIHNLAFYMWLVRESRKHILAGDFGSWKLKMIKKLDQRL